MIYLDTETYCEVPLKWGTYRYAEACEVMLITYAIDDGPIYCWDRTSSILTPPDLAAAFNSPDELVTAHNAMFDRNVMRANGIVIPAERWRCTMMQALSHGLPGGLGALSELFRLGTDEAKQKEGRALIQLFCKPRPKNSKLRRATRHTHRAAWQQFIEYAKHDISAMRVLAGKMPVWNMSPEEVANWHLDQRVNDRGFGVDTELVQSCLHATEAEQRRLKERTNEATGGELDSTTKRDKTLEYLFEHYGVSLPDMKASTIDRRLADPSLPQGLKDLLQLRSMASTSSTAKYQTILRAATGGRIKGALQFAGAGRTGRWAGRTVQPQNYPSKGLLSLPEIREGLTALRLGCEHLIFPDVMRLLASTLRPTICAEKGNKLVWSDLSNVEGRCDVWLAGEEWKLQLFRDIDAGVVKFDTYVMAYAKAFGVPPESVQKWQRQIGKVMELMLARGGGVGSFIAGALAYNMDLDAMAQAALPSVPAGVIAEAKEFLDWSIKTQRGTFGISGDAFIACDALKRLWRLAHPAVVSYWKALEDTARQAIAHPGETFPVGLHNAFRRDGAWLRFFLADGHSLCYASPQVGEKGEISTMGINPYTKQWQRMKRYGGKFFADDSQATACRVLKGNMPKIDEKYDIVLTIHDEVITEVPDSDEYSAKELSALLAAPLPWSDGLPLEAKGHESPYYFKD